MEESTPGGLDRRPTGKERLVMPFDSGHATGGISHALGGKLVRALKGKPLAQYVESGRDNILVLRLIAALMVILGHCYGLVGHGAAAGDPVHWLVPVTVTHHVGVMMFFAISGFLITMSFERRPHLVRFLQARALRLWPALVVCVAVWAFVLGPALSTLTARAYFTSTVPLTNPYAYFAGNASLFDLRHYLPGLFATNPVPAYVNGSLWTLPYEATMYLCVAALGVLGVFRYPLRASAAIAVIIVSAILWRMYAGHASSNVTWFGISRFGVVLAGFFGAGAIACLSRRHLPISTGLLVIVVGACLLLRTSTFAEPALFLAVAYAVLWFAYVPNVPSVPNQWDLSYGTYLWAFPLQQAAISLTGVTHPLGLFAMVTPIVLVIALASWTWIEKPALRFKGRNWSGSTPALPAKG